MKFIKRGDPGYELPPYFYPLIHKALRQEFNGLTPALSRLVWDNIRDRMMTCIPNEKMKTFFFQHDDFLSTL
jgi:hypothetical protein